ncbi:hypothetical protein BCR44DRAFT_1436299 [Catenaria anguillulae PL171]|uniref:Uncharacterized protein n=1 Tax=Catenaria anguillulae PL171 TaxID=765915 RepID=A0A1Y2HIX2_9FUNG|nr:hypothetical protein BCR44DRAFT_1436299 [Catenaria anguillulae PL171]
MRQKVRESLFMQRFAMRGVLAVLNSGSFLVPMWISCYSILTTGQRGPIALDAVTTTTTFLGSVFDPIITIAQDKKLRRVIFSWDWGAPLSSPAGSWGNVSAAVFSTRSAGAATMGTGVGVGASGGGQSAMLQQMHLRADVS